MAWGVTTLAIARGGGVGSTVVPLAEILPSIYRIMLSSMCRLFDCHALSHLYMNWTEILKTAGIPDPPGYFDTVKLVTSRPKRVPRKKKKK